VRSFSKSHARSIGSRQAGGSVERDLDRRHWPSAKSALMTIAALALTGCLTPSLCNSENVDAAASIDVLTCQARLGSKRAAYMLGRRYEQGSGVVGNRQQATRFYRQAARPTPSRQLVYRPKSGSVPEGVYSISTGGAEPGLPEASEALARLGHGQ
jgi:hypothetical protein